MDFQTAVKTCFNKYATFSGRARTAEFWWFVLFSVLGGIAAGIIDSAIFGFDNNIQLLGSLFSLAILLPSISVAVRRLHDLDKSGWWWWLWFIPIIGWIILIIWYAGTGTQGDNRFGADPLRKESYSRSPIPEVDRGHQ